MAFLPYYSTGKMQENTNELTITFDKGSSVVKNYSLHRGIKD